jgi:hypothetical protein
MLLFKKKLTREQQEEILKFAHNFYHICAPCRKAFDELHSHTSQLYKICKAALQRDVEPEGVDTLIEEARVACEQYTQFLTSTHDKYRSINPPAKWYPKELREVYDSWGVGLEGELGYLEGVTKALQPPKPLSHDPQIGSNLNLFVQSLNYVAYFETTLRKLRQYDMRSTELLLGIDLSYEEQEGIISRE